jgi:hypothetical protein
VGGIVICVDVAMTVGVTTATAVGEAVLVALTVTTAVAEGVSEGVFVWPTVAILLGDAANVDLAVAVTDGKVGGVDLLLATMLTADRCMPSDWRLAVKSDVEFLKMIGREALNVRETVLNFP